MLSCYVSGGDSFSKVLNDPGVLATRHAVVTRKESVFLVKPFTAVAARISSLSEM